MTTILINGIDTLFGARIAQALATACAPTSPNQQAPINNELHVLGIGKKTLAVLPAHVEVLSYPSSAEELTKLLQDRKVSVVIHVDFIGEERSLPDREAVLNHNILGTMRLLGACASAGVKRVVLRSSTLVYGANFSHPLFITEDQPFGKAQRSGLIRDYIEVENFVAEFVAKRPDMSIVVLRCAGLVGGGISSPMSNYLLQRFPPILPGFDPRIQVLHIDDAITAFIKSALSSFAGVLNIATESPLTLRRAIRLLGKQPAQIPEGMLGLTEQLGIGRIPFDKDVLKYSCVVSTQRAAQQLDWQATYSAEAALQELRNGIREGNAYE